MDFVSQLAQEAGIIGRRAKQLFTDGNILGVFRELGLALDAGTYGSQPYQDLQTGVGQAIDSVDTLLTAAYAIEGVLRDPEADPDQLLALAEQVYTAVRGLLAQLKTIQQALQALQAAPPDATLQELQAFAATFVDRLTQYLLLGHLQGYHPNLLAGLTLLGVVRDRVPRALTATVLPSADQALHLAALTDLLRDPAGYLKSFYGWNTGDFASRRFLLHLEQVAASMGLPVYFDPDPYDLTVVPVLHLNSFLAIRPATGSSYAFDVELTAPALAKTLLLPFSLAGWEFEVYAGADLDAGSVFKINWDGTLEATLANLTADAALRVTARLPARAAGPDYTLLTTPFGTGLTASAVELTAAFTLHAAAVAGGTVTGDMSMSLAFKKLGLNVAPGNTDSFIGRLLGGERQKVKSDLALDWTRAGGLAVRGGKGLLPKKQVNLKLGPLQVLNLALGLDPQNDATRVVGTFGATAQVGPVRATAEDMGFAATLGYAPGNLGPFDLRLAFQGPKGVGIAVESDLVTGGGYLYLDPEHHKYAGAASLQIKLGPKTISLNALGLLQTQLPNNPDAYSLLLLITATGLSVQLGLGFALQGLGGLLGLNRAADTGYLRGLLYQGQLDKLLFPPNVMDNPAEALATVDQAFPATEGRYLIGLMGRLGWGLPDNKLLLLDVALLVELPSPVRLLLLGVLRAFLPSKSTPLLTLRADFLGSVDFGSKKVAFDATLSESKILVYSLSGDMAFRLYQGANPVFLISAGGFHPSFRPPAGADLPPLRRLTLALAQGDNLRLTLASYFAVTSNTVQFGAHLDFYFNLRLGLHVEGHFGLDTLFQFNPFRLEADMAADVAIKRGGSELLGIHLALHVTGPGPWHIWGEASFRIWFVKISVDVDGYIGQNANDPRVDAPDVRTPLVAALTSPAAWAVEAPATAVPGGVALRPADVAAGQLFLDPRGALVLTQRVAPLGLTLERYGNGGVAPAGGNRFDLLSLTVGDPQDPTHTYAATDTAHVEEVRDFFAPDQFRTLRQDERLSLPSFQRLPTGLRLKNLSTLTAGAAPKATRRVVQYERKLRTSGALAPLPRTKPLADTLGRLARGGALGQLYEAALPSARTAPPVGWQEPTYAVVQAANLEVYQDQRKIATQAEAEQYRRAQPTAADLLVVPTYQLDLA